ncbi:MAG TPA: trigger factor [Erysipelotrichaceae bacterium]|nr:trigger factor [Erysipelotrichaceae bacterium]
MYMSNWTLKEKSMGDLEVTISGEDWKKAVKKAFDKIARNVTIDGFRKGQAPKALIERRVPASERYMQAVEDNANHWLQEALKEQELEPIDRPVLDIRSMDAEQAVVVFTFPVEPEAKLGDYKSLKYEVEEAAVTDEDVDKEINSTRERYAEWEVTEEAAENGDTVNINYKGLKDGVAFDGGTAENHDLVLGSGSFIPGFEEQLVGVKAGDEKALNLTFPEDYHSEELAGAAVVFEVKVNEVKKKVLPEVNDDFAKDLNWPDVESLDDLKKTIRERLETSRKNTAENEAANKLMEQLVEMTEVEVPEIMIENEVEAQIQQFAQQVQGAGLSLSQYMKFAGLTVDSLKESYRENAEKGVKSRLALKQIAKLENLTVSDEEAEKELEKLAEMYGMKLDDVKQYIPVEQMKGDMKAEKALNFLKGLNAAE